MYTQTRTHDCTPAAGTRDFVPDCGHTLHGNDDAHSKHHSQQQPTNLRYALPLLDPGVPEIRAKKKINKATGVLSYNQRQPPRGLR